MVKIILFFKGKTRLRMAALAIILLVGSVSVWAVDARPPVFDTVWYRNLPAPATAFRNSHYSFSILGFSHRSEQVCQAYMVEIHPDQVTRTKIHLGSLINILQLGTGYSAMFRQSQTATAIRMEKPQGWPVSTLLQMDGLVNKSAELPLVLKWGAKPGQILINGEVYHSLTAELARLAAGADTDADAAEFLRLGYISVILFQTRVAGFGTSKMIGIDEKVKGLASGYLRMLFQARGFLGLGNSGVQFLMQDDASDMPGLAVTGDIFAGVYKTEGILSFFGRVDGKRLLLGTLDFSQVKTVNAISVEGAIGVHFAAVGESGPVHWISYNVLPN